MARERDNKIVIFRIRIIKKLRYRRPFSIELVGHAFAEIHKQSYRYRRILGRKILDFLLQIVFGQHKVLLSQPSNRMIHCIADRDRYKHDIYIDPQRFYIGIRGNSFRELTAWGCMQGTFGL